MRHILILGAGRSATVLIQTLFEEAFEQDWMVHVADADLQLALHKVNGHERGHTYGVHMEDAVTWQKLIDLADVVVSMLPPPLHSQVAKYCLQAGKHFLNASYLSPSLKSFDKEAREKGVLFLCEMGLDPGIDHMSAMEIMDEIRSKGGIITSFRSHCGGLVAPESDNNPWHYKISWNPRNIITAGKDGARFLENGNVVELNYQQLFDDSRHVEIPSLGRFAWYPNRDSLVYKDLYGLNDVKHLVRTTLRHPAFIQGWKVIVENGYTNENDLIDTNTITYKDYFNKILNNDPVIDEQIDFIGGGSNECINMGVQSPASILQALLVKHISLAGGDKDMIVMLHEIGYQLDGKDEQLRSVLAIKGKDDQQTAMAQTVGLPLAIAVKLILNKEIDEKGVHIPISKTIYRPVLKELLNYGIYFKSIC